MCSSLAYSRKKSRGV
ncbi:hypothetical protein Zm00014a_025337 [Zea mays]|uniref:Uncharacterized protein n=1 Tax=Zea mays TaxID=4577 RepID=A0A3L6G3C4_MAIZE|nr:hypothetical protein Zm00014a_025337 [Zea mays]